MNRQAKVASYAGAAHDARWRSLVFPKDYANPRAQRKYHLVVLGAGPAGLVCALGAAGLGARVALVERHAMGGDCLNVGCVPSKALLEYTRRRPGDASFDDAFAWMREVRASIAAHDSVLRYTDHGIDVFLGEAQFVDDLAVQVQDQQLVGRRVVIATGARAAMPGIPGLREARPLTNESVFDLEHAPRSIAIIGAGAVGCELAQAFARMGITVHLLDQAARVLSTEDPRASELIANALRRDGVRLYLDASIERVERAGRQTRLILEATELRADEVLVAAGRNANVETLNLDVAGVEIDERGLIKVDRWLRTTNKRIYAAGDVCARLQFTHHADAHARIVIQNALFAPTARADALVIPHCTYTSPEIAQVGATRAMLEERQTEFARFAIALGELDRGRMAGDTGEYAELLLRPRDGRILGGAVAAEQAGELIVPVCIAMSRGLTLGSVAKTVFPYPTRSEYLRSLADSYNRTRLTPAVGRVIRSWLRLIG